VRDIANTYAFLRDSEAADRYFHRAIDLDPDWPTYLRDAMRVHLRLDGDPDATRSILAEARGLGFRHPLLTTLSTWVAISEGDYAEALDLLDEIGVDEVEANSFYIPRAQMYAEVHGLLGDQELRQVYYDSSRIVAEERLRVMPDDPRVHSALGIAYAGLGRGEEALSEGETGVALRPVELDAWHGVYRVESLAVIHTMLGDYDDAIDLVEYLLSIPGTITVPFLKIDYRFDPLRGQPRFQELLRRYD
jgi:Flp pilus assembly protein TadD